MLTLNRRKKKYYYIANKCIILKCLQRKCSSCLMYSHIIHSAVCFAVGGSDEVEVKDELTKIETVGQQVQGGKTVYQQGAF